MRLTGLIKWEQNACKKTKNLLKSAVSKEERKKYALLSIAFQKEVIKNDQSLHKDLDGFCVVISTNKSVLGCNSAENFYAGTEEELNHS